MDGDDQIEAHGPGHEWSDPQRLAAHLRARARAICEAQPLSSAWDCETQALRETDALPCVDLDELGPPDTEASEHLIWISEDKGAVLKATAYGRFGHDFDRRKGGALPSAYLLRMAYSNEFFEDSIRVVGRFQNEDGTFGLLIGQDFIFADLESPLPTEKEIIHFMQTKGFIPVEGLPRRFVCPGRGIEVDDTHPGNFVRAESGEIIPVDLLIRRLQSSFGQES